VEHAQARPVEARPRVLVAGLIRRPEELAWMRSKEQPAT
jgi:hypothetical protein